MRVGGQHYRTIWPENGSVAVIDQTRLPFELVTKHLLSMTDAAEAISTMVVRGAPLIGATAAYGVALAMAADPSDASLDEAVSVIGATRPTAVNLHWALDRMESRLRGRTPDERAAFAFAEAGRIAKEDVECCRAIGEHGAAIIREIAARKTGPVNILTHCNAGWLAAIDWGTALAPVYVAHEAGIPLHVWVDETRPRNQGAALTAFELAGHGVPHTVIADNAGGHLMQHGEVDICIVGSDRTTATGDVGNKIGTYLKALAARDNGIPFYAALPFSTIDWSLTDGVAEIPIEERSTRELTHMRGRTETGELETVEIVAPGSPAANPAFDVTPARLVTGIITERGVALASREGLLALYPEQAAA
jgi:methylthioribose-1-phosphate isomerase